MSGKGKETTSTRVRKRIKNMPVESFVILHNSVVNRKIVRNIDVKVPQQWRWTWMSERVSLEGTQHKYGDAFAKVDQPGIALCKWCEAAINYSHRGRNALADHVKSKKHMDELSMRTDITGRIKSDPNAKLPALEDRVVEMEAMIRSVLAEHNLPASLGAVFVDVARNCSRDLEALAKVDLGQTHDYYKVVFDVGGTISPQNLQSLQTKLLSVNITDQSNLKIMVCLGDDFLDDAACSTGSNESAVEGASEKNKRGEKMREKGTGKKSSALDSKKRTDGNADSVQEKDLNDKTDSNQPEDEDVCFVVVVSSVSGGEGKTLDIFHLADVHTKTINAQMMFDALCEIYAFYQLPWENLKSVLWESRTVQEPQRTDLLKVIREKKSPQVKDGALAKSTMALSLEKKKLSEIRQSPKSGVASSVSQSAQGQEGSQIAVRMPRAQNLLQTQPTKAVEQSIKFPHGGPVTTLTFEMDSGTQQPGPQSQPAIQGGQMNRVPPTIMLSYEMEKGTQSVGPSSQQTQQVSQTNAGVSTFSSRPFSQLPQPNSTPAAAVAQNYPDLGQDSLADLAAVADDDNYTSLTAAQGLQALSQGFHQGGNFAMQGYQPMPHGN